jgi:hypothetical protein
MAFFKRILPVALTIAVGWLVLISFLPLEPASPLAGTLTNLRAVLLEWAVILAAFALLLGFINLLLVHYRRIRQGQGILFSLALIVSALLTLGLWIGSLLQGEPPMAFLDSLFKLIVAPLQSAAGALLAILIAVAGFRALSVRRTLGMVLFVLTAVVVVLTQPAALFGDILEPIRAGLIDPITTGSLRGLLLGVALGSLAVGVRLLVGADRPQGD